MITVKKKNFILGYPSPKKQAEDAYKLTTRGAWIGIGLLAFTWITIRFIGPGFGWWSVN